MGKKKFYEKIHIKYYKKIIYRTPIESFVTGYDTPENALQNVMPSMAIRCKLKEKLIFFCKNFFTHPNVEKNS